jgi:hypothetical protein
MFIRLHHLELGRNKHRHSARRGRRPARRDGNRVEHHNDVHDDSAADEHHVHDDPATNDDRHIHDDCGTVYLLDVDDTSHVVNDHVDDVDRDIGGLGDTRDSSPVGHRCSLEQHLRSSASIERGSPGVWFCEVCGERSTTASRYGVRARKLHGRATEGVAARHYYTGRWAKSLSFKPGQICGNSAGVTADGLWRCEQHWFT